MLSSAMYPEIIRNFKDQTVIVLGGASGIGLATLEAFYKQGACVISIGLTPMPRKTAPRESIPVINNYIESLVKSRQKNMPNIGGEYPRYCPEFIECDVTKMVDGEYEVARHIDGIGQERGGIDVIVDSIGWSPRMSIEALTPEMLEKIASANSHYLPFMFRTAHPWLTGKGRVVVIGSTLPHGLTDTTAIAYGMAKAARLTATLGVSKDFGQSRISICVVSPSHVPTENELGILGAGAEATRRNAQGSRINGIELAAEDVADFVLLASSKKYAPLITGREILLGSQKGFPLQGMSTEESLRRAGIELSAMARKEQGTNDALLNRITALATQKGILQSELERAGERNDHLEALLRHHGIDPDTAQMPKTGGTVLSLVGGAPKSPGG